ncbi:MAG: DUF4834 family protein [Erysipelotrichaceae bacterium]
MQQRNSLFSFLIFIIIMFLLWPFIKWFILILIALAIIGYIMVKIQSNKIKQQANDYYQQYENSASSTNNSDDIIDVDYSESEVKSDADN